MRRRPSVSVRRIQAMVLAKKKKPFELLVQRKLQELKKIIPKNNDNGVEALLRTTAEYICFLELKVTVLRDLANLYGV
ncbi:hypothetical protein ACMD2_19151 [Ananas comosus]|uniref:BHLH domain-containing protein n=1 Tax=Ananas comosus TaxID=4615 RepID=A0A199W8C5_ANACO|nr:hypothetical protein ACMD2_19151 [Ananas comosus]